MFDLRAKAPRALAVAALGAVLVAVAIQACSLAFPLDGLGDQGDATGGADGTSGGDDSPGTDAGDSGVVDASHFDETPFVPEAGCVESGAACISPAPAGWQGPFIVYDGNQSNAPTCGAPEPNQILTAHGDLNPAPQAQCSPPCGCNPPTGGACSSMVDVWGDCSKCGSSETQAAVGSCIYGYGQLYGCNGGGVTGIAVALIGADGGSCTGTTQTATKPPFTWQQAILGCSAGSFVQADCAQSLVCVPLGAPPFEANACVMQAGDVGCPGQPYSSKRLVYGGADDTRGCSTCTCGPPTGIRTCPTTAALYGAVDTYCNPQNPTHQAAPFCVGPQDMIVTASGPPTGGSCAPSGGGAPTGGVTPSDPITVCCIP
jgi:hypothetical protein